MLALPRWSVESCKSKVTDESVLRSATGKQWKAYPKTRAGAGSMMEGRQMMFCSEPKNERIKILAQYLYMCSSLDLFWELFSPHRVGVWLIKSVKSHFDFPHFSFDIYFILSMSFVSCRDNPLSEGMEEILRRMSSEVTFLRAPRPRCSHHTSHCQKDLAQLL